MGLTRKQALLNCRKMWEDMANTNATCKLPSLQKLWPGRYIVSACWACEFATSDNERDCRKCPLWHNDNSHDIACCYANTEYMKWVGATFIDDGGVSAANAARMVVELCDRKLVEYGYVKAALVE